MKKIHGNSRHGHAQKANHSPTYVSWICMKARCSRINHADYKNYVARGIKVCERWLVFDNFLADMGERPVGKSLDRINNNLGYEPGNCRWATKTEQQRNRSNTIRLEFHGERLTAREIAERIGMSVSTLRVRLYRGMTIDEAILPTKKITERQRRCGRFI